MRIKQCLTVDDKAEWVLTVYTCADPGSDVLHIWQQWSNINKIFDLEPKCGKFIPPWTDRLSEPYWPANAHWYELLNLNYVSAEVYSTVSSVSLAIYQPWLCFHRPLICISYLDGIYIWFTGLHLHLIFKCSYSSSIHNDSKFLLCSPKQRLLHVTSFRKKKKLTAPYSLK